MDEYKALVLVYCPVIIPLIWREWQTLAQKDFENATARWEAKANRRDEDKPKLRIHPQDANNFLKLAATLKIILGRKIRNVDIPRAKQLLSEYLHGYLEIHEIDIKPNHHWVTHIFDQILDFGPVYGFWTFTSERLNKLLKSFTTNNHNGGEIEVSFFRTFCKDALLRQTLRYLAMTPREGDQGLSEMAAQMIGVDKDIRGTVASVNAMVQEVEDRTRDCGLGIKRPSLGAHIMKTLSDDLQMSLLDYYNDVYPEADFHTYIIIDGRRITPSTSATKAPNSIIQTEFDGQVYAGQVISVLTHSQFRIAQSTTLLHVHWFRRLTEVDTSLWDLYSRFFFWEYNNYLRVGDEGPPPLVPPSLVKSQAARATVNLHDARLSDTDADTDDLSQIAWVTTGLSREAVVI
ncbi:hypothetical protein EW145_g4183 [Phellinidium pouzarii]|uniref:Uncharacterized protein n=1 Tax=Phellinidium pouzarii TaxID=167371 RepID=A0A4S4L4F9_9AGAM|nr:hypothetical protein EW145_g4183 [Phellinidium pouzarii]